MNQSQRELNMAALSGITQVLENLVRDGYGPQGRQTLLSTSTGHVTVTNSGAVVLSSLHLGHPVAR